MIKKMRIGVTLGDPAGIGPEIVAAALALDGSDDAVVYGDREILAEAAARMGVPEPRKIEEVTHLPAFTAGLPSEETGRAQLAYLEAAVADARAGRLDALVTAPIHKASAIAAGFLFPGHTEFLAARLGAPRVTMMFAGPRLRVSLATIHASLAQVPSLLSVDSLIGTIVQTADALVDWFGLDEPRIAIAGLNPHAGENGHFGNEERRVIEPAIDAARGLVPFARLSGPDVPDAVFRAHLDGKYDAVVALYHDQGLIPVKLIDFEEAVNLTLGLPIVRTSPDHGVAHDIAGTGRARPTSMRAAIALARQLARARR